jgi:hypothetical protein
MSSSSGVFWFRMTGADDSKAVDCRLVRSTHHQQKNRSPRRLLRSPGQRRCFVGPSLDQPVPSWLTRVLGVSLSSFMPVSALKSLFNDIKWIHAFLAARRERELLHL